MMRDQLLGYSCCSCSTGSTGTRSHYKGLTASLPIFSEIVRLRLLPLPCLQLFTLNVGLKMDVYVFDALRGRCGCHGTTVAV